MKSRQNMCVVWLLVWNMQSTAYDITSNLEVGQRVFYLFFISIYYRIGNGWWAFDHVQPLKKYIEVNEILQSKLKSDCKGNLNLYVIFHSSITIFEANILKRMYIKCNFKESCRGTQSWQWLEKLTHFVGLIQVFLLMHASTLRQRI